MTGSVIRMTHAPSANFVTAITAATTKLRKQPKPLMATPLRQPGFTEPKVVLGHPGLRQGEAGEDTDRVERDERGDLGAGGDHQGAGDTGEHEDAVRVHEAVASLGHLAREEAVARLEARESREVGETGVRRHHEDEHRPRLKGVVEDLADGTLAVDGLADLADDRRCPAFERRRP